MNHGRVLSRMETKGWRRDAGNRGDAGNRMVFEFLFPFLGTGGGFPIKRNSGRNG